MQFHGQSGGQIGQVGCQIQLLDLDAGICVFAGCKGRGLGAAVKVAAIEIKRQLGQHFDFALGGQGADKGHGQLQAAQLVVACADGQQKFVCKIDLTAFYAQVVERKGSRLGRGLGFWRLGFVAGLQGLQNIVKVVAPIAVVGDVGAGCFDGEGIKHRCHAPNRLDLGIGNQALDAELRALAIGLCHLQIAQRQFQRPGFEIHRLHADFAPQGLAALALNEVPQSVRCRQPGQHQAHAQHAQTPSQLALPGQTQTQAPTLQYFQCHIQSTRLTNKKRHPNPIECRWGCAKRLGFERGQHFVQHLLGIAKQHAVVFFVEKWVVHTGVA